jgi:Phage integrase, N-terminal SAM-like domain
MEARAADRAAPTSVEDNTMSKEIRDQFVRDMQVAGLAPGTQQRYVSSVNVFLRATWASPESTTERDVQDFLIAQRDLGVARETFRGYRYALQFLFGNTLGRDWPLFKKN